MAMLALFSGEPSSVEVAEDVPGGGSAGTRAGQRVVQLSLTDDALLVVGHRAQADAVMRREVDDTVVLRARREVRRHLDLVDAPILQYAGQPADMIRVEVTQHENRDVLDSEVTQAPIHRGRIRARVDDNRRTLACSQYQAIALTHVAHHEEPVVRRPTE